MLEMMYFAAGEPQVVLEAEDRHAKILDADYSKVNMDEYVHELSHLTPEQIDLLRSNLKEVTHPIWRWAGNIKNSSNRFGIKGRC